MDLDLAPSCSNSSTCCIMNSGSITSVTVTATASNSNTTTSSASTSNETQQQRQQQPHPPQHLDQPPAVDYERQREELLRCQLHADRRFHELRPQLHQKRLAQIEKLQDDILNRRSDVFERRKQQLDVEFDTRRRNLLFAKQLRLGALERKLEGQRTFSADNLAMDQARSRQRIGAQIDAKLQRLAEEERQLGGKFCGLLDHNQPQQQPQHHQKRSPLNGRLQAQMPQQNGFLLHGINSNGISIRTTKSNNNNTRIDRYRGVQEDNSNQPAKAAATSIMPNNRRVSSRRSGGSGGGGECRTRLRDLPILIAQLPRRAIAEDLAKAVAHPVAPAAAANAKFKPTTLSKSTASKPN